MIENVDINKELAVKNREIFLNKLNMDLDGNFTFLKLTTSNIIDTSKLELVADILNILNSFMDKKAITNIVSSFFDNLSNKIQQNLELRFALLKTKCKDENYITFIDDKLIEELKTYYLDNYHEIIDVIDNCTEFEKERVDNYLTKTFYEKLINRFLNVINNANMLLINNYYESLDRYNLMNEKTVFDE